MTTSPNGMRLSGFFMNTADLDPTSDISTLTAQASDPFLVTFYPNLTTGVAYESSETALSAYPVPCQDVLHVVGAEVGSVLQLIDPTGRLVSEGMANMPMYLPELSPGLYLLRSIDGDGMVTIPVVVGD